MGLRESRRSENQLRVVSAALYLLTHEGIESVTMARIAKRMGASVGGLYRYYPHKEAIFVAIQLHALEDLHHYVETTLGQIIGGDGPEGQKACEVLGKIFTLWRGFRARSPILYDVLARFSASPNRSLGDEDALAVDQKVRPILEVIATGIENAADVGLIREGDALQRTFLVWATLQGLGAMHKRDHLQPEALKSDGLHRAAAVQFLSGWGASEQTIDFALELTSGADTH